MNEIRLFKLALRDFQGGTFTLEANGKDVFIFGANEAGKTRLVSAFSWLLFNKDALGRNDFEIKNLDAQGEAAHGLEHSVEGEFALTGQSVILKKIYREKWAKKRGNISREFSGHTTEYFIDGVPVQEKDYNARIGEMTGDESRFRLLTSPVTFPALHWQKQRGLLLEICGDISDGDVIASDEKLSSLPTVLGKHTLEDHRKVVITRRSEINKEMERIPVRIDENRRAMPDVTGIDRKASEEEAQKIGTALNDAKLRLQGVNTGGNIADLTKKISSLNADLRKLEEAHRVKSLGMQNILNQQILEVRAKVNADRLRIQSIDGDLKFKEAQIKQADFNLSELRRKWGIVDGENFENTISDTCPACGQALPAERVQAARDKALAHFNERKAETLGEINQNGKGFREQRDRLQGEIYALHKEKEILVMATPDEELHLKNLTEERDILKLSSEDFSGLQNRADLLDEIENLEVQIKAEREGRTQDIEKVRAEISDLDTKLIYARSRVLLFEKRDQGEKRIEDLKADEKRLSAEFERLEGELYLIEQFIKTKVSMLTERINGKFEIVRFKLFNTLINGGIEDCCEITVRGVPFNGGLNNAARIQAGCDIIRTLQQHFQMRAPVFCDNRESVTDLPQLSCQMISLVVSPEDKILRVEIESDARKAVNA